MKFFQKGPNNYISQVVVISMIFGFAAGVVGQIIADVYIDPYNQDFGYNNLNTNTNTSLLELRPVKRFLGIEQDFEVNNSIEKIEPAIVGFYVKKAASNNILNQLYLPDNLIASGITITSDGWLVTDGSIFNQYLVSNIVVVYNNKVYSIDQEITDITTGLSFVKISEANMPVVVFGDSSEAVLGQLEIAMNDVSQAVVTNIKNLNYNSLDSLSDNIYSSEEFNKSILLADALPDNYLGSPLVNLGGEVIGIISNNSQGLTTAVPINQFRSIVLDVLRNNTIKRTYLGVAYIDLAKTVGVDRDLSLGLDQGALVYQNPSSSSPAGESDIKKDDIIISVDGQQVNHENGLTELIQQYQPGDEVVLEVLRDGDTVLRPVILGIVSQ